MRSWAHDDLNQFSLLHTASPETLDWLQDQVTAREFVARTGGTDGRGLGQCCWLKVRSLGANQEPTALAVLGRGDIFGEMAGLDEAPRSTDVQVYALTANIFLELLSANRVRRASQYRQVRQQVPAVKLANSYGEPPQGHGGFSPSGGRGNQ
ncbi:MAG: cyclic nucleotide-binding domain-containing protein [Pseudanabaenaceae cyanobacterium]